MKRVLKASLITLGLALLIFGLRKSFPAAMNQYFWGADGWFMANLVETSPFPLYYRSLLTVMIHKAFYWLLHPMGVDGWNAISLSSSLAGSIALRTLWKVQRDVRFLAINVLCGSFVVLLGHVENYAWVNALLIVSFYYVQLWLREEKPAGFAITFLMLACFAHMLALFYIPAYAYVLWKNRRFDPKEVLIPILVFTFTLIVLSLCFQMLGTDIGMERLVPLGHKWAHNQFFTFLSPPHLAILFYFHHRAAFLGIPIELPLLFLLRKKINTLYLRFLLGCTLCGLFWTTIWHPDWGRLDWDLFSQFGIPLHFLLGLLIRRPCPLCTKNES